MADIASHITSQVLFAVYIQSITQGEFKWYQKMAAT